MSVLYSNRTFEGVVTVIREVTMKYKDYFWMLAILIVFFCSSSVKTIIPYWSNGVPIDWSFQTFQWSFYLTALLTITFAFIVIFKDK